MLNKSEFLSQIKNNNYFDEMVEDMKQSKLPIIFLGTGTAGKKLYPALVQEGVYFDSIATGNEYFKPDSMFFERPVYSIDALLNYYDKVDIFIGFSTLTVAYKEFLLKSGKVENVYLCDSRYFYVSPDSKITYSEIEQNADRFCKVYNSLADDLSQKTLLAYLSQCASQGCSFLENVCVGNQYFINEMNIGKQNEIFMDCGAYDGDTTNSFINYTKTTPCGYKKIYCIECDAANFKNLMDIKAVYPDIECIHKGVWDKKDILYIDNTGKTNSRVLDSGNYKIEVDTIDNILNGNPVTFLKMDIEGAELNALHGAEQTILQHNPKLAICVYHNKFDIVDIFEYLSKLHPYKFYLRAHSFLAVEVVLYAICDQ